MTHKNTGTVKNNMKGTTEGTEKKLILYGLVSHNTKI